MEKCLYFCKRIPLGWDIAEAQPTQKVGYFFHHSEAIVKISGINVIRMQWYETRFKQSLLPDEIILKKSGYKLTIPDKWKKYKKEPTS